MIRRIRRIGMGFSTLANYRLHLFAVLRQARLTDLHLPRTCAPNTSLNWADPVNRGSQARRHHSNGSPTAGALR